MSDTEIVTHYELYVLDKNGFEFKDVFINKEVALRYAEANFPGAPFITNPVAVGE